MKRTGTHPEIQLDLPEMDAVHKLWTPGDLQIERETHKCSYKWMKQVLLLAVSNALRLPPSVDISHVTCTMHVSKPCSCENAARASQNEINCKH